jgi:hypothetical protein
MPPETEDPKIPFAPRGEIVRTSADDMVTGFYVADGFTDAVRASDFDITEEVSTLIGHVRHPDPKVSLAALRHWRTLLKEIATANGYLGVASQEMVTDNSGTRLTQRVSQGLLSRITTRNTDASYDTAFEHHPALSSSETEESPFGRGAPEGADPGTDSEDGGPTAP